MHLDHHRCHYSASTVIISVFIIFANGLPHRILKRAMSSKDSFLVCPPPSFVCLTLEEKREEGGIQPINRTNM